MEKTKIIQTTMLPMSELEVNHGQIKDVPRNPRFIRDEKYRKLVKSINDNPEMLALQELKVYPFKGKYVIIGGNMRYRAMSEIGYQEAPCKIIPAETTAAQLRAYIIKDNVSYGEWDIEDFMKDWNLEELEDWGIDLPEAEDNSTEKEAEEDNYTGEIPKTPKSKLGDMYKLGRHRLVCGDSLDPKTLEALMGETTAHAWITDPPYNVNYESADGKKIQNDQMEDSQFQDFLTKAFCAAVSHLKMGGAFYIWHADSEGYNFRAAVKKAGLKVRQCLIWKKNSLVLGRQDYQWIHEPCLYGWKEGGSHYFTERRDLTTFIENGEKPDLDKMKKEDMKELLQKIFDLPTSVIEEDKPLRSAEHPTMKPLKLMGRQIMNSTRRGETVLDTFGGSGSTLMACEQLDRVCATVELDPKYVDVIIDRWEEYTGKRAELFGNFLEGTDDDDI